MAQLKCRGTQNKSHGFWKEICREVRSWKEWGKDERMEEIVIIKYYVRVENCQRINLISENIL